MRKMFSKNQIKELAVEGIQGQDIAPKDVAASGKVTGNEIIENMSGYSFNFYSITGYDIEGVYVGACKNGNKLTLIIAFNITRTEDSLTGNIAAGQFTIPSSIGEKLFPTLVGTYNYLDNKVCSFWSTGWTHKEVSGWLSKASNTALSVGFDSGINTGLDKNVKYYCRYEATFLLSDNLVEE